MIMCLYVHCTGTVLAKNTLSTIQTNCCCWLPTTNLLHDYTTTRHNRFTKLYTWDTASEIPLRACPRGNPWIYVYKKHSKHTGTDATRFSSDIDCIFICSYCHAMCSSLRGFKLFSRRSKIKLEWDRNILYRYGR